ncbi:MAG: oligosaccharide flippase family protein [Desulfobacterales bacterium]|nr:oligosaccharide flippase family protein [Desulfobacterales bacterium]
MTILAAIGSQYLATGYAAVASMLLVFFLGRVLGPEEFGLYNYILTIASYFAILQDGGWQTLIFRERTSPTREIPYPADELLSISLGHLLFVTCCGMLIAFLAPIEEGLLLALAVMCLGFACAGALVSSDLKGRGRFGREAAWQAWVRTATAAAIVAAVCLGNPKSEAVFIGWTGGFILCIGFSIFRRMLPRPRLVLPPRRVRSVCLSFFIVDAAAALYFRIDVVMLRHFSSDFTSVGNYVAAYRMLDGVILLLVPAVHICFRHLRLNWRRKEAFTRLLVKIMAGMAALLLMALILGFTVGPDVVRIVYGEDFAPAMALFPLILISLIFIAPNFLLTRVLIALNRERFYAMAALFAAAFNIGLNLWLIPRFQARGAAWATIATEGVLMALLGGGLLAWRREKG